MKLVSLVASLLAVSPLLLGQAANGSSIDGQVVNVKTGAAVRRASVNLRFIQNGRGTRPGEPPVSRNASYDAVSDDEGRFSFRDLEAGSYQLMIQRQGFTGTNSGANSMATSTVYLGEGQRLTGYMARLMPQSVIAGKVLDAYGDPVQNAQVAALRAAPAGRGSASSRAASAQTNDLGEFRLASLSPGEYIIAATPPSNMGRVAYSPPPTDQPGPARPEQVSVTTYYPGATEATAAKPVTVESGAEVPGIDITLARVNAMTIRGTVVDESGSTVGNSISVQTRANAGMGVSTVGTGSVNSDGTFLVRAVPPGSYNVVAQRFGSPPSGGPSAIGIAPVDVADKSADGVTVRLRSVAELQGTVKADAAGQCSVHGSSVRLSPADGIYYGANPQPAVIGDDNKFTLHGVGPVTYTVSLNPMMGNCYVKSVTYEGRDYPDTFPVNGNGSVQITLGSQMGSVDVTVVDRDGKPAASGTVTFEPVVGQPSTRSMGFSSSSGRVTMASLRPGDYWVFAFERAGSVQPPYNDLARQFQSSAKAVTVPENGRVSVQVTLIPASEYGGGQAAPAPIPAMNGSLAGQVVHAVTGAPIAGVNVTVRGGVTAGAASSPLAARTDDQGRFAFRDLAPGFYQPVAQSEGFLQSLTPLASGAEIYSAQIIVGEGQNVTGVVLKLTPQAVISGKVTDESGEPVVRAQVAAYRYVTSLGQRRLAMGRTAETDDLGMYRILNLPAGEYYVEAYRRDLAPPSRAALDQPLPTAAETGFGRVWYPKGTDVNGAAPVRVNPGSDAANTNLTLPKVRVARIRGTVTDAAGPVTAAPYVSLSLKDTAMTNMPVGSLQTLPDGRFEISGVPAGSYWLTARPGAAGRGGALATGSQTGAMVIQSAGRGGPNMTMAVAPIDVKDQNIDGLKLEMTAGREVPVSVKMENGNVVGQCISMTLVPSVGTALPSGMNCQAGKFTLRNVWPMVYTPEPNSLNLPANYYVKAVRYAGKDIPRTGMDFSGPGEIEVIVGTTAATIEGTVQDRQGKPAGGAALIVAPSDGSELRTGNANERGEFYFANLVPGEYRVYAWAGQAPETVMDLASLRPFASSARTLTVGNNAREEGADNRDGALSESCPRRRAKACKPRRRCKVCGAQARTQVCGGSCGRSGLPERRRTKASRAGAECIALGAPAGNGLRNGGRRAVAD